MSTLSINCFLLGDDSSKIFTVKILETENVSILTRLIKEVQPHRLNHVDPLELIAWKPMMSLPVDTITPELTVDDVEAQQLHPVKKISSIYGKALVDEHVHILVQAPPGALHKRKLTFPLVSIILSSSPFTISPANRSPFSFPNATNSYILITTSLLPIIHHSSIPKSLQLGQRIPIYLICPRPVRNQESER